MPHAIHVTTANVTDRAGALAMFDRRRDGLSQVQNVLVDGGYTGKVDRLLEVLAGFGAAKLPVAAGWRADDKFPIGGIEPGDEFRIGGINPDGIIFLTESPYGPGCHYLEVERRAQHEGTLKNKFKSYLSDNRSSYSPGPGDPPPLLFFCPSERIEALVHQIAAGFPVLTITEKRWRQNTPFDGWSQFGTRVRLG